MIKYYCIYSKFLNTPYLLTESNSNLLHTLCTHTRSVESLDPAHLDYGGLEMDGFFTYYVPLVFPDNIFFVLGPRKNGNDCHSTSYFSQCL